uniref:2-succinylbenzoate--CoA ligase n=1 Tax=Trichocoleus desertorum TaxID=1481672 RepID=UPI0025B2A143|nr:2-succinylbenzoate--CoA ligase [Trichocoleus desertorum]
MEQPLASDPFSEPFLLLEHSPLLEYLEARSQTNWLIGINQQKLTHLVQHLFQELAQFIYQGITPKIFLAERSPEQFLAGFIAACAAQCPVFLCNPHWVEAEWQQVLDLVTPDLIWGDRNCLALPSNLCDPPILASEQVPPRIGGLGGPDADQQGWIMIPTGGSSGRIRFAIHTWSTLMASVRGCQQYFQVEQINSYCVLPIYHVSGLMQFLRSFASGGQLVVQPFKQLEAGEFSPVDPAQFFISLVPTQLQRLLEQRELTPWLAQFHTVLLGGSPAWSALLETARRDRIRLAPTYGMTETASQIATLYPEDFLAGHQNSGRVLPHGQISIHSESGKLLPPDQVGQIRIQAESLTLGYYPQLFEQPQFQPDDLGYFNEQGYLHVVGRSSHKIITGGENVFPTEVEAAIRATNLVQDVCVIGIPDVHWGQVVTALYVSQNQTALTNLIAHLQTRLSKFKQPKYWIPVEELPRNSQSKINYEQTHAIALNWLQNHSTA